MKKAPDDLKDFVKRLIKMNVSGKELVNCLDDLLVELLVPGAYYLRKNPANPKQAIFGQVLSPKNDLDQAILNDKKYRLVKAYSVSCIDGEYGTETVDVMLPISAELFEYAKSNKWNITARDAMQFVLLLSKADLGQTPKGSA